MTTRERAAGAAVALSTEGADGTDLAAVVRRLVVVLNQQQAELASLHEAVATVEGRTQRHEAGQDAARTAASRIAELAERVEQESTLRRDLVAALERQAVRDTDERAALVRQSAQLAEQVEELRSRVASAQARSGRVVAGRSEQAQQELSLGGRLSALEQQIAAAGEELRAARDGRARAEAASEQTQQTLDRLTEQARSGGDARRRLEQEIGTLRASLDGEHELRELIEQQRAARIRMEERIAAFDGELHEAREQLAQAAEQRSVLQQQLAGDRRRIEAVTEALEAQREAIVEHFQRWTEARGEAGKRAVEEIGRTDREARDLLVRLAEGTAGSVQEQPL